MLRWLSIAFFSGLSLLDVRLAAAAEAPATPPPVRGPNLRVAAAALALPPRVKVRARSSAAPPAAYTVHDVGLPDPGTYASSLPVGFNDSGQIFGTALPIAKANRQSYARDSDCLVWTGTRFIDISPSLTLQACTPSGINAPDGSGSYQVVGVFSDIYHTPGQATAAVATISAQGTFATQEFYDYFPSALYGVNSGGLAVGGSNNLPDIFVTALPGALRLLQPACGAPAAGCLSPVQSQVPASNGTMNAACAFGGCAIDDAGNVLGYDVVTERYAVRTSGGSPATIDLPVYVNYTIAMNDANEVLGSSARGRAPGVYDWLSGAYAPIGAVPGTSCASYYPLSMNNLGQVLGFTANCSQGPFYWIWDATHGTQNLNVRVAPNSYTFAAFGINDNGQILVSLETASGAMHWGTLDPAPVAAGSARAKGAHHGR